MEVTIPLALVVCVPRRYRSPLAEMLRMSPG